jgi:hypothetical protein
VNPGPPPGHSKANNAHRERLRAGTKETRPQSGGDGNAGRPRDAGAPMLRADSEAA